MYKLLFFGELAQMYVVFPFYFFLPPLALTALADKHPKT
jgi:hypothetical protein